ncbi:polyprenyl synthetase family protein [Streptomyces sp. 7N604]|uniref:polyprenyl synthetase family protein n=1 Tax=Streptomyces sp. 7N604 TaxID=3457415 RepID=UPI003FD21037
MTVINQAAEEDAIRDAVDAVLHDFLDVQEQQAQAADLKMFTSLLREIISAGGKRIRPLLCVTGWQAASDAPVPAVVYRLAASLELFHAFALIHDDIMDNSDMRRGRPAAHRALEHLHPGHRDRATLGRNGGILLGDLALGWSYDLLHHSDSGGWALPWDVLNTMRTETLIGQYLDLSSATQPSQPDMDTAWHVIRYKTVRYTFERPLQVGALLAGASREQHEALATYAAAVGEAFQLRDDLLGVFGNPDETGKPALDDLREGKRTVLVATAWENASGADRRRLVRFLGDPGLDAAQADEVRDILTGTGAVRALEAMITERRRLALAVLDGAPLSPAAAGRLRRIADAATSRTS